MEVSCLMLAAYAELSEDGKVSVLGGDIDTVRVPTATFPTTSAVPLYLIGKIRFSADEGGRDHPSRIELIAPDGTVLESAHKPLSPPLPVLDRRQSNVGFLLVFFRMTFPVPGEYTIQLSLDGAVIRRMPIYVEQVPESQERRP
jgi:hypothetical protein